MSVNEKMTAIANNIRNKTGGSEALTLDDMANGVNEVFDAGQKAQYDAFWDAYQSNGTKKSYELTFAGGAWNPNTFKPKYLIAPTSARMMFYKATKLTGEHDSITNIDFSNCTDFGQAFQNFAGLRLGVVDLRQATEVTNGFANCNNLVTVDKFIVDESFPASLSLVNNPKLENISIEGVLAKSFNASKSPLTVNSIKSVITSLADNTGTANEYKYTVTFLASAFEEIEAEGETAEYNGVACTWAELIDNKKWNLVKA
ncbi:MAG: hypothetical protein E7406_05555 [Ruminococcaceae bacterium]|nr:hypothetical protein [Oscillospiraceae bacterium]